MKELRIRSEHQSLAEVYKCEPHENAWNFVIRLIDEMRGEDSLQRLLDCCAQLKQTGNSQTSSAVHALHWGVMQFIQQDHRPFLTSVSVGRYDANVSEECTLIREALLAIVQNPGQHMPSLEKVLFHIQGSVFDLISKQMDSSARATTDLLHRIDQDRPPWHASWDASLELAKQHLRNIEALLIGSEPSAFATAKAVAYAHNTQITSAVYNFIGFETDKISCDTRRCLCVLNYAIEAMV